jgi:hypothetical protein
VIVWDGLNEEERESAMHWMSTAKLWKQRDSLSTIKKSESTVEGKLQSLLEERGWSLTGSPETRGCRRGKGIVDV